MRSGRAVLAGLVALDLGLVAWALALGRGEVRTASGSVTTGLNVAFAIAGTFAAAFALRWFPVSANLRWKARVFALAAIATHAAGHLARWYYDFVWFDDLLHFGLVALATVLAVRFAEALGLFPARHATPLRAAVLAVVASLAIAGVWEIFEFGMDVIQSSREQDDLRDTMLDMIDGLLGGFAAGAWLYRRPRPLTAGGIRGK